jgi:hypothetical protein
MCPHTTLCALIQLYIALRHALLPIHPAEFALLTSTAAIAEVLSFLALLVQKYKYRRRRRSSMPQEAEEEEALLSDCTRTQSTWSTGDEDDGLRAGTRARGLELLGHEALS